MDTFDGMVMAIKLLRETDNVADITISSNKDRYNIAIEYKAGTILQLPNKNHVVLFSIPKEVEVSEGGEVK